MGCVLTFFCNSVQQTQCGWNNKGGERHFCCPFVELNFVSPSLHLLERKEMLCRIRVSTVCRNLVPDSPRLLGHPHLHRLRQVIAHTVFYLSLRSPLLAQWEEVIKPNQDLPEIKKLKTVRHLFCMFYGLFWALIVKTFLVFLLYDGKKI